MKGIGDKTKERIVERYEKHVEIEEIYLELKDLGFTLKDCSRILKKIGKESIDKIKRNP